jgi:tRNA-specific 2-thiouridylase
MAENTLYVVQGHDHPWLLSAMLEARDLSWVAGEPPSDGTLLGAKTRYRQADAASTVRAVDGDVLRMGFDEPQWAVTPGQSAVLYQGEVCLGGGIIQ